MYKTSILKVCSLNCCYKNAACGKVFVISAHGRNTNAQIWSFPFEVCEVEGKTKKYQAKRGAGILIKTKDTFSKMVFLQGNSIPFLY